MELISVRHDWPEKGGFNIYRPNGRNDITFLHFLTPVNMEIGTNALTVKPGGCIFFVGKTPQHFWSENPICHNWMHLTLDFEKEILARQIPVNQIFYPKSTDFISEIFTELESESFSDRPDKNDMLKTLLSLFFIRLKRSITSYTQTPSPTLSALRARILSHPEFAWTVEEMAAQSKISPSRLHTVYKAAFGTTPMSDVIDARMRYAVSLLRTTNASIKDISAICGYNDEFHFIRQFKSRYGLPPNEYRKKKMNP